MLSRRALLRSLALAGSAATVLPACGAVSSMLGKGEQSVGWPLKAATYPVWSRHELYDSEAALQQLKATGANTVCFAVTWYAADEKANAIERTGHTATDASLVWAIDRARDHGLEVMLKPHVDLENQQWRAFLQPSDPDAWFASYREMLYGYAALAQEYRAVALSVGSELASISADPANEARWRETIVGVRQTYKGKLTYSANWGGGYAAAPTLANEFAQIPFWDALDYLGISAYFELTSAPNPDLTELTRGWERWKTGTISPFRERWGKPLLFTEVGYRDWNGTARAPWDFTTQGAPDPRQQADCWEALFRTWANVPWFAGAALWMWGTQPAAGAQDTGYLVQGKPAQARIAQWYGGQVT